MNVALVSEHGELESGVVSAGLSHSGSKLDHSEHGSPVCVSSAHSTVWMMQIRALHGCPPSDGTATYKHPT